MPSKKIVRYVVSPQDGVAFAEAVDPIDTTIKYENGSGGMQTPRSTCLREPLHEIIDFAADYDDQD